MTEKLTQKLLHIIPLAVTYVMSGARAQSSQQVVGEAVPLLRVYLISSVVE
jgi:hypothetical protein